MNQCFLFLLAVAGLEYLWKALDVIMVAKTLTVVLAVEVGGLE